MNTFKDKILNIFFPRNIKCHICGEELSSNTLYSICDTCMKDLPFNNGKICIKCGGKISSDANYCINCKNDPPLFKYCRSAFLYKDPIIRMIRNIKYDNMKYLSFTLSNFVASTVVEMGVDIDIVIPVPMSEKRLKIRGYNQSDLLCKSLKEKLHLNVRNDILTKIKDTSSQAYLSKEEREENLRDSFKVMDKNSLKGKRVLLVDDVFTTGSTLNECTRVLLKAGAKEVYCVTLAHTDISKTIKV